MLDDRAARPVRSPAGPASRRKAASGPILIFSKVDDIHARAVQRELDARGARHVMVDLADYPTKLRLAHGFGAGGPSLSLEHPRAGRIELDTVPAAWWRRPQPYRLHADIRAQAYREFALGECYEAMQGTLFSLPCRWINHPLRDDAAHRKLLQLRTAQAVGLTVPETLVTNDPAAARRFVAARGEGRTVYKSFSATEKAWRETRVLRPEEVDLIDAVRYAPVIFQDLVDDAIDLRVTAVGDRIFPASIHPRQGAYPVDFRMDMDHARIEATDLPAEVIRGIGALMQRLGLVYGAIDIRRTEDGRHVFLEVNPAGQWLFVEQQTGQPIAAAVAEALIGSEG